MIGIIGFGGHARVVSDIYQRIMPQEELIYFSKNKLDDEHVKSTKLLVDSSDVLLDYKERCIGWHPAIGDISNRKEKFEFLAKNNFKILSAIHDTSIIADSSSIGIGTAVMAGVVINPLAKIGKGCIVNTAASIDHDCQISDYVNFGPGCRLAGGITVGSFTNIGTGAIVIPNIKIGSNCVIGAGAVVIADIPDNSVAVGVPARIIRKH